MPRKVQTHYSPPVGQRLVFTDTITGEEVHLSTLSVRDKTDFKHRTPKGTPKGEEYFYVREKKNGDTTYIRIMNSLLRDKCSSEDGRYVFEGKLPNGRQLPHGLKKSNKEEVKKTSNDPAQVDIITTTNIDETFVSEDL